MVAKRSKTSNHFGRAVQEAEVPLHCYGEGWKRRVNRDGKWRIGCAYGLMSTRSEYSRVPCASLRCCSTLLGDLRWCTIGGKKQLLELECTDNYGTFAELRRCPKYARFNSGGWGFFLLAYTNFLRLHLQPDSTPKTLNRAERGTSHII